MRIKETKIYQYDELSDEAKENAALIAAAPNMLKALKLAIQYIPREGDECLDNYELCQDAIAQAEGKDL